nr:GAF domain-containing sensor histidine kinase [Anaerolineales bacterium]
GVLGGWVAVCLLLEFNPFRWPEAWGLGPFDMSRNGVIRGLLITGWGVMVGASAWMTLQAYRRTPQPLRRNRIAYWAPVLVLSAAGDALFFSRHSVIGAGVSMPAAAIAGYALLNHNLLDVRQAARLSLAWLLAALGLAAAYGFSFAVVQAALRGASALSQVVAATGLALLASGVFTPLLRWTQRQVNRWIARTDYEPARLVREYSLSISNILDVGQLAQVALGVIRDGLGARHGLLFLVDRKRDASGDYFGLRSVGEAGLETAGATIGALPAESPVAEFLYKEYRPLTQYDIDLLPRFRAATADELAWLAALDVDVYVPIYAKGTWIGLLALGAKTSGDRYFDQDLELLSTLADQTTVALENARLVDNLVTLNRTLREAYGALDQANQRLEHLDQAKSDFIAVLSHELRTPLGILLGYSQMMADDPEFQARPGYQAMMDGLSKGASRLQEIIETMLDMAMIDNRQMKLYHRPVPLMPMLQAVSTQFMTALQQRRLTLTLDESLTSLPKIEADTETLGKVFYQLIINAIKFTPDGGRITLSGLALAEGHARLPGGGVEVVVADTGIGIDPRYQELIFAKFYQTGESALHSSGKTKFKGGGPGLGLAIARGIVEAHGGQIWVDSPGYDEVRCPGSRFHVALPVRQLGPLTAPDTRPAP